ncbi:MAG: restriction endonuclease subunit S [Faecalibacterium sp.]|nr:restriction endonuclease subunit S [Faecalibacterium sp.]
MARKMKDSGIEWIGEIPEGWEVSQLKYATRWKSEKGCPDAPVLSLYRDFGVVPKDSRNDNHNVTSLDTSNYKVVDIRDLVINKMKAWQGSMAVSDYRGIVSPAYHVCSITSNKVNKRYLHHLLRNPAYLPEYARLSTGMRIGQWDLGFDDFKNIPFLIPPLDEQAKIADYLDNGCASLDVILDKTRSSIEEYKKLKQAVITQAVTKGVRGEREMKDSGNPWFGQIPTDWKLSRVGLHFSIILGKMLCNAPLNDTYTLEPYYCAADVHFDGVADGERKKMWFSPVEKELYRVSVGDLLVVEGGAGAGGSAIVENQDSYTYIQNSIMIVRSKGNTDNRYLRYLLEFLVKQGYIDVVCNKATIPHFTKDKLSCVPFCLCPTGEQKEIADYLDAKCAEIDKLIAKKEQLVKELENYKKSLIFEYVTGKKELRR